MRYTKTGRGQLLLLLALLVAGWPAPAAAQQTGQARSRAPLWSLSRDKTDRPATAAARPASRATVTESEPNDDPLTADSVALSDTVSGVIGVAGDIDFFGIDLVQGTVVDFDVDAQVHGSALDAILILLDAEGYVYGYSDDEDGLDSRIRASIPTTARYYLGITDYYGSGGANFTYQIRLGQTEPGPGDPTTTRPSGADAPWTIAAGATGELYVLDWYDGDVWRVPASGAPTRLAGTDGFDMALDAFGDLLVVQPDSGNIMRLSTTTGARSRFASMPGWAPLSITIAPDGDVWTFAVGQNGDAYLFRFSPYGVTRESIDMGEAGSALKLAFSPGGMLHISNGSSTVYRMNANRTFTPVFQTSYGVGGMTFDAAGSMYLSTVRGGLLKLDASYHLLHDPFAFSNLEVSGNTAFLRTGDGAMTARLVASDLLTGLLVEMNPAGITTPGARVGTDLTRVTVTIDQAAEHVLGGAQVGAEAAAFLDGQGNGNGVIDVGDLRALVRAQAASATIQFAKEN